MTILNCVKGKVSKAIFGDLKQLHDTYLTEFQGNVTRADAELMKYVSESNADVKKSRIMTALKMTTPKKKSVQCWPNRRKRGRRWDRWRES